MGYVIAAYALVVGAPLVYGIQLARERRHLRRLIEGPSREKPR